MLSIVWQGDHRYNVYRSGRDIGCITVSGNPYHNQHCYVRLGLDEYDPAIAAELFSLLRSEVGRPLQVMLYSWKEKHDFLTAGGFARRRRCYELEVSPSDLAAPVQASVPLHTARKDSDLYDACCGLMYAYYSETHEAVSPLTASQDAFCSTLPGTVVCCMADGSPIHYAFVEPEEIGYEIACVGTTNPSAFSEFAQALVHVLFQTCGRLSMECDNCDPAAMTLKSLFRTSNENSYDTYVLE